MLLARTIVPMGNADPVVDTRDGPIRGSDDGLVKVWKGVRYAAAPTGDLRWRAPQNSADPPGCWPQLQ